MVLELRCVGSVGGVDYFTLKGDENLRFAGGLELRNVQRLYLFLVYQYDVDPLLELVDHSGLQVFVEWHQGLTGSAPGRMDIDDDHFGISFCVVAQEVVSIADSGGQLDFLGRHEDKL